MTYACENCGRGFNNKSDLRHIESENINVCKDCFESNFFSCKDCGKAYRYDGEYTVEVYTGTEPWDYGLICKDCLKRGIDNGNIYWDKNSKKYYRTKK